MPSLARSEGAMQPEEHVGFAGSMVMLVDVTLPLPTRQTRGCSTNWSGFAESNLHLLATIMTGVLPDTLNRIVPGSGLIGGVTCKLPVPEM